MADTSRTTSPSVAEMEAEFAKSRATPAPDPVADLEAEYQRAKAAPKVDLESEFRASRPLDPRKEPAPIPIQAAKGLAPNKPAPDLSKAEAELQDVLIEYNTWTNHPDPKGDALAQVEARRMRRAPSDKSAKITPFATGEVAERIKAATEPGSIGYRAAEALAPKWYGPAAQTERRHYWRVAESEADRQLARVVRQQMLMDQGVPKDAATIRAQAAYELGIPLLVPTQDNPRFSAGPGVDIGVSKVTDLENTFGQGVADLAAGTMDLVSETANLAKDVAVDAPMAVAAGIARPAYEAVTGKEAPDPSKAVRDWTFGSLTNAVANALPESAAKEGLRLAQERGAGMLAGSAEVRNALLTPLGVDPIDPDGDGILDVVSRLMLTQPKEEMPAPTPSGEEIVSSTVKNVASTPGIIAQGYRDILSGEREVGDVYADTMTVGSQMMTTPVMDLFASVSKSPGAQEQESSLGWFLRVPATALSGLTTTQAARIADYWLVRSGATSQRRRRVPGDPEMGFWEAHLPVIFTGNGLHDYVTTLYNGDSFTSEWMRTADTAATLPGISDALRSSLLPGGRWREGGTQLAMWADLLVPVDNLPVDVIRGTKGVVTGAGDALRARSLGMSAKESAAMGAATALPASFTHALMMSDPAYRAEWEGMTKEAEADQRDMGATEPVAFDPDADMVRQATARAWMRRMVDRGVNPLFTDKNTPADKRALAYSIREQLTMLKVRPEDIEAALAEMMGEAEAVEPAVGSVVPSVEAERLDAREAALSDLPPIGTFTEAVTAAATPREKVIAGLEELAASWGMDPADPLVSRAFEAALSYYDPAKGAFRRVPEADEALLNRITDADATRALNRLRDASPAQVMENTRAFVLGAMPRWADERIPDRARVRSEIIGQAVVEGRPLDVKQVDAFLAVTDRIADALVARGVLPTRDAWYAKQTYTGIAPGSPDEVRGRGFIQIAADGNAIIGLARDANLGTLFHENAHLLRRILPAEHMEAVDTYVRKQFGGWTEKAEEWFAVQFESVLTAGKVSVAKGDTVTAKFVDALNKALRFAADVLLKVYEGGGLPSVDPVFAKWMETFAGLKIEIEPVKADPPVDRTSNPSAYKQVREIVDETYDAVISESNPALVKKWTHEMLSSMYRLGPAWHPFIAKLRDDLRLSWGARKGALVAMEAMEAMDAYSATGKIPDAPPAPSRPVKPGQVVTREDGITIPHVTADGWGPAMLREAEARAAEALKDGDKAVQAWLSWVHAYLGEPKDIRAKRHRLAGRNAKAVVEAMLNAGRRIVSEMDDAAKATADAAFAQPAPAPSLPSYAPTKKQLAAAGYKPEGKGAMVHPETGDRYGWNGEAKVWTRVEAEVVAEVAAEPVVAAPWEAPLAAMSASSSTKDILAAVAPLMDAMDATKEERASFLAQVKGAIKNKMPVGPVATAFVSTKIRVPADVSPPPAPTLPDVLTPIPEPSPTPLPPTHPMPKAGTLKVDAYGQPRKLAGDIPFSIRKVKLADIATEGIPPGVEELARSFNADELDPTGVDPGVGAITVRKQDGKWVAVDGVRRAQALQELHRRGMAGEEPYRSILAGVQHRTSAWATGLGVKQPLGDEVFVRVVDRDVKGDTPATGLDVLGLLPQDLADATSRAGAVAQARIAASAAAIAAIVSNPSPTFQAVAPLAALRDGLLLYAQTRAAGGPPARWASQIRSRYVAVAGSKVLPVSAPSVHVAVALGSLSPEAFAAWLDGVAKGGPWARSEADIKATADLPTRHDEAIEHGRRLEMEAIEAAEAEQPVVVEPPGWIPEVGPKGGEAKLRQERVEADDPDVMAYGGARTARDMTAWIAAKGEDPKLRAIARRILPLVPDDVPVRVIQPGRTYMFGPGKDQIPQAIHGARGVFRWNTLEPLWAGDITVRGSGFKDGTLGLRDETVLHEVIHAVVNRRIYEGNLVATPDGPAKRGAAMFYQLNKDVVGWFSEQKRKGTLPDYAKTTEFMAAMNSPNEFTTYALTSESVQAAFKQIRLPGDKVTLWTRFVEAVRSILGLTMEDESVLARVIEATNVLLEDVLGPDGMPIERPDVIEAVEGGGEKLYQPRQIDTPEFRRWFGNSKVVDEKGRPLVVYHGTPAGEFDVFRVDSEAGAHFGTPEAAGDAISAARKRFGLALISPDAAAAIDWAWSEVRQDPRFKSYMDEADRLTSAQETAIDSGDEVAIAKAYADIAEFEESPPPPGYELATAGVARRLKEARSQFSEGERVIPVYLSIQNPIQLSDPALGAWGSPDMVKITNSHPALNDFVGGSSAQMVEHLQKKGYDGIVYQNKFEGKGSTSYIAFRPEQIKSAVANVGTFDPENPSILYQERPETKIGMLNEQLRATKFIGPDLVATILTSDRPEYLDEVAKFVLEQREKARAGTFSPRDVAKAYVMTLASQQASAAPATFAHLEAGTKTVDSAGPDRRTAPNARIVFSEAEEAAVRRQRELGIAEENIVRPQFHTLTPDGRPEVRPEETMAAWFFTPMGRRALDNLERGVWDAEAWEEGAQLRDVFGANILRSQGAYDQPRAAGQFTLRNITDFTKAINAAKGDPKKVEAVLTKAQGVGRGKKPFIGHLLGFGENPTIDAVEIWGWVTGQGDRAAAVRAVGKYKAELARALKDNFGEGGGTKEKVSGLIEKRIRDGFQRLRKQGVPGTDMPEEVFGAIMHHWFWDKLKGTSTTHEGMMASQRFAQHRDYVASALPKVPAGSPPPPVPTGDVVSETVGRDQPQAFYGASKDKEGVATPYGMRAVKHRAIPAFTDPSQLKRALGYRADQTRFNARDLVVRAGAYALLQQSQARNARTRFIKVGNTVSVPVTRAAAVRARALAVLGDLPARVKKAIETRPRLAVGEDAEKQPLGLSMADAGRIRTLLNALDANGWIDALPADIAKMTVTDIAEKMTSEQFRQFHGAVLDAQSGAAPYRGRVDRYAIAANLVWEFAQVPGGWFTPVPLPRDAGWLDRKLYNARSWVGALILSTANYALAWEQSHPDMRPDIRPLYERMRREMSQLPSRLAESLEALMESKHKAATPGAMQAELEELARTLPGAVPPIGVNPRGDGDPSDLHVLRTWLFRDPPEPYGSSTSVDMDGNTVVNFVPHDFPRVGDVDPNLTSSPERPIVDLVAEVVAHEDVLNRILNPPGRRIAPEVVDLLNQARNRTLDEEGANLLYGYAHAALNAARRIGTDILTAAAGHSGSKDSVENLVDALERDGKLSGIALDAYEAFYQLRWTDPKDKSTKASIEAIVRTLGKAPKTLPAPFWVFDVLNRLNVYHLMEDFTDLALDRNYVFTLMSMTEDTGIVFKDLRDRASFAMAVKDAINAEMRGTDYVRIYGEDVKGSGEVGVNMDSGSVQSQRARYTARTIMAHMGLRPDVLAERKGYKGEMATSPVTSAWLSLPTDPAARLRAVADPKTWREAGRRYGLYGRDLFVSTVLAENLAELSERNAPLAERLAVVLSNRESYAQFFDILRDVYAQLKGSFITGGANGILAAALFGTALFGAAAVPQAAALGVAAWGLSWMPRFAGFANNSLGAVLQGVIELGFTGTAKALATGSVPAARAAYQSVRFHRSFKAVEMARTAVANIVNPRPPENVSFVAADGRVYSIADVMTISKHYGLDETQARSESAETIRRKVDRMYATYEADPSFTGQLWRVLASFFGRYKITENYRRLYEQVDVFFRYVWLVRGLQEGLRPEDAVARALRISFDYSSTSQLDRWINMIGMFWMYQRRALDLTLAAVIEHPSTVFSMIRFMRAQDLTSGYADLNEEYERETETVAEYGLGRFSAGYLPVAGAKTYAQKMLLVEPPNITAIKLMMDVTTADPFMVASRANPMIAVGFNLIGTTAGGPMVSMFRRSTAESPNQWKVPARFVMLDQALNGGKLTHLFGIVPMNVEDGTAQPSDEMAQDFYVGEQGRLLWDAYRSLIPGFSTWLTDLEVTDRSQGPMDALQIEVMNAIEGKGLGERQNYGSVFIPATDVQPRLALGADWERMRRIGIAPAPVSSPAVTEARPAFSADQAMREETEMLLGQVKRMRAETPEAKELRQPEEVQPNQKVGVDPNAPMGLERKR